MDGVNPSAYTEWNKGYMSALEDLLNDDCQFPIIVEAREQLEKKARRANS